MRYNFLVCLLVKMPDSVKADLLIMLSEVEHRMSLGSSEKLQLGAVCAAFSQAKQSLEAVEA